MDKQQKNVQQLVASKVLKDIHKIVTKEERKEKREKHWGLFSLSVILLAALLLALYLTYLS